MPPDQEGEATVPLTSRDKDTLLGHCARAIDYTLDRFGAHGLPLMGTGDWDDGINLVGARGRGESVWVGFFLHGILTDIAPLFEAQGRRRARRAIASAPRRCALRSTPAGAATAICALMPTMAREVAPMSAMTASWPVLSGAVDFARGTEAIDKALPSWRGPTAFCW